MAAGLPTLVTRTGGAEALVAEGVTGAIFAWADVDSLTAHLRRLSTDRTLARQMGAAARARANSFTWEIAAQRYRKMFAELI